MPHVLNVLLLCFDVDYKFVCVLGCMLGLFNRLKSSSKHDGLDLRGRFIIRLDFIGLFVWLVSVYEFILLQHNRI